MLETIQMEIMDVVKNIAKEAGGILLGHFNRGCSVHFKHDDRFNPVTQADLEADSFIRGRLLQEFPEDRILSEENPDIPQNCKGRTWIVDPMDGTQEFVNGRDGFAVVIGLCVDGLPKAGVVFNPVRNELYFAERGKGAFLETEDGLRKITVSDKKVLSDAMAIVRIFNGQLRQLDGFVNGLNPADKIEEGGCAMKICRVASGEGDVYVHTSYGLHKWDTCGPQVIIEEAGGRITDLLGVELDYEQDSPDWKFSAVVSNGGLHDEVIKKAQEFISNQRKLE